MVARHLIEKPIFNRPKTIRFQFIGRMVYNSLFNSSTLQLCIHNLKIEEKCCRLPACSNEWLIIYNYSVSVHRVYGLILHSGSASASAQTSIECDGVQLCDIAYMYSFVPSIRRLRCRRRPAATKHCAQISQSTKAHIRHMQRQSTSSNVHKQQYTCS